MHRLVIRAAALVTLVTLAVSPLPASAVESHNYHGQGGFSASFPLAGGQYSLYVDAHFTQNDRTHSPDSCIFTGALKRISPTVDSARLGTEVPIRNPIHYKMGPAPMTLPAGRYQLYVASMSDCEWTFSLEASTPMPAGLGPITLYGPGAVKVDSSSIGGTLEFNAPFGLGNAQTPPTGTMQVLHDGKVVEEHPLAVGTNPETHGPGLWVALRWDQSDAKLIGQNVARFIVKIGSSTYTQSRAFTIQP